MPHQHSTAARSGAALALLLAAAPVEGVQAQISDGPAAREAERAVRRARDFMYELYLTARLLVDNGRIPRGNCEELNGDDCFAGDRECPVCLWDPHRRDMMRLALLYDSTAAVVARAPAAVSPEMHDWLATQRVGVWARMGITGRAAQAADECLGSFWVCEALRAHVEHLEGEWERAAERFRLLLRVMPAGRSCGWRDVRMLMDTTAAASMPEAVARRVAPRDCTPFDEVDRFWILADPLFTVPGNDRMTEHFSRLVDLFIHEQHLEAATFSTICPRRHSLGHHSSVLRHGWPTEYRYRAAPRGAPPEMSGWAPRRILEGAGRSVAGAGGPDGAGAACGEPYGGFMHLVYGNGGQSFVPATASPEQALTAPAPLFEVQRRRAGETYRPFYGPVESRGLQAGFFRHAGQPVLVVRTTRPSDAPEVLRPWAVRTWSGAGWRDGRVDVAGDTATAWVDSPWQAQVVSVEALHFGAAYRARSGTRPPADGPVAISSLVLLAATSDPPDLEAAVQSMLPDVRLPAGRNAVAYWEVYTSAPSAARFELVIRHTSPGVLTRVFGAGRRPEQVVRWTEELRPAGGVASRAIRLDLGALPPGEYRVSVAAVLESGSVLATGADFTIAVPGR
jgi:hypothetical protein